MGGMTRDEFIRQYLAIDTTSPTGLTWTGHPSRKHATRFTGKSAGADNGKGYYVTQVQGRSVLNHRIVWFLHHGEWPSGCIDHIDGDSLINHPDNLRDVSLSENQHNKLAKGCYWHKRRQRWMACIKVNGKRRSLGYFTAEADARSAYLNAKRQLHPTAPERCYA